MPCIGLMAGSVLIKSFLLWLATNSHAIDETDKENDDGGKKKERNSKEIVAKKGVVDIMAVFIGAHLIGVLALFVTSNKTVHDYFSLYGIPTSSGIFYLILLTFICSFLSPKILKVHDSNSEVKFLSFTCKLTN